MRVTLRSAFLIVVLLLGSSAESMAAGPALSRPPRLLDSGGRVIGSLLDVASSFGGPTLIRRQGAVMLLLLAYADGSGFDRIGADGLVYYDTPDCSGQGYVRSSGGILFRTARPAADASPPFVTFYYPGDPIETRVVGSRGNATTNCETFPTPFPEEVGPAQIVDLSGYTPPFRLK